MGHKERKFERHDIKKYAHVEIQMPCVVSDISKQGAQLEMPEANSLPDKFVIALAPGLRMWCEVKWRTAEKVGIQFIADPTTANL
jgi:hypothetical protein